MNTLNALLHSLRPFAIAASITFNSAIAIAQLTRNTVRTVHAALTSEGVIATYRTAWIGLQLAFWLAVAAGLLTVQAGRRFRAYYEAEWAADVQWLIDYPDRCITTPVETVEAVVEAFLDDTLDLETAATAIGLNPDHVQTVINGSGTATKKLRGLASLAGIPWRNARGKGKHMSNANIRSAMAPFLAAEVLAQLG